jgi:hypothetical protein
MAIDISNWSDYTPRIVLCLGRRRNALADEECAHAKEESEFLPSLRASGLTRSSLPISLPCETQLLKVR